jgi:hypothetical protein
MYSVGGGISQEDITLSFLAALLPFKDTVQNFANLELLWKCYIGTCLKDYNLVFTWKTDVKN